MFIRLFKYAFLFHKGIWGVSVVFSTILLYAVFKNGLKALLVMILSKSLLTGLIIYFNYVLIKNISIFYMNMNFEVKKLQIIYFLVDVITFAILCTLLLTIKV